MSRRSAAEPLLELCPDVDDVEAALVFAKDNEEETDHCVWMVVKFGESLATE
jgi:hypothetical protein